MQLVALFVGVVITSSMQLQGQGNPVMYDDVRYFQENRMQTHQRQCPMKIMKPPLVTSAFYNLAH